MSKADSAAFVRDPTWLAHRYDPASDAVHFLACARAERDRATFLTDEYLAAAHPVRAARRADALAGAPPAAPMHLILHSAFCCSTLLARALDRPGLATSLKEPVILNDLVGWRRRGAHGDVVLDRLDGALTLLARPFEPGEAVVVKPSNVAAGLAEAMLALRPQACAVLLHTSLPAFLGSVARKGLWGRRWVRELFAGLRQDRLIGLGLDPRDDLMLTDLQVAAVGWLAQHALFAALIQRFGPGRVRPLHSERLLADPSAALGALFGHFGWSPDDPRIAPVAQGPAFTSHSKTGTAFVAGDRLQEQSDAAAHHADEIGKVVTWSEAVAAAAGLAFDLPHALA